MNFRCILEVNRKEADALATRMSLEQVRERDQLLTAQNEMLKVRVIITIFHFRTKMIFNLFKARISTKFCHIPELHLFSSTLQADKTNLQKRVAELDDMVKKIVGIQSIDLPGR